jgi:hypothetical protein
MKNNKITVEKLSDNNYKATGFFLYGKSEVTISMTGHTAFVAEEKLKLCIKGEPYSHLEKYMRDPIKSDEEYDI